MNNIRKTETIARHYCAPEIEIQYVDVECGFAASSTQLPDYEEDEDVIIIG